MQTYKNLFRKKKSVKKRPTQKQKQKQSQKNRIMKGLICYRIKIAHQSNGGGPLDTPYFDRLEKMIQTIIDNLTYVW